MSGVYQRNRNLSEREFYTNAIALRNEVMRFASKAIPKSQRFTLAVPMVNAARDVLADVVRSDSFYPNTERGVEMRRYYLALAKASCEMVIQDVQTAVALCYANASEAARVIDVASREMALITGARKNVRLIGQ